MCSELSAIGILGTCILEFAKLSMLNHVPPVFYQEDQSTIAVLDFNSSQQFTITLPVRSKCSIHA